MARSHTETFSVDFENHLPPMRAEYRATVEVDEPDYPGGLGNAEVVDVTPITVEFWEDAYNTHIFVEGTEEVGRYAPQLDDDDVIRRVLDQVAMRVIMRVPL